MFNICLIYILFLKDIRKLIEKDCAITLYRSSVSLSSTICLLHLIFLVVKDKIWGRNERVYSFLLLFGNFYPLHTYLASLILDPQTINCCQSSFWNFFTWIGENSEKIILSKDRRKQLILLKITNNCNNFM